MHCGIVLDVSSHVDDILPPCSSLETIYVGRRSGLHTGNMELLRDETGEKKQQQQLSASHEPGNF